MGAALGTPPVVAAIIHHEIAPECLGEDPMFSERIFEKMYNASRARPALERGVAQPDPSRRRGMVMEAIAGVDIAIWDVKAQALGIPLYQALGAVRSSVRGYASGGWAPGDEAEAELGGYAAKGFTAVKMRVVGRDGFSIANCVRRVKAARRGIGADVELMVDAHGSLEVAVAIKLARELEPCDIAWFEEPVIARRCSKRSDSFTQNRPNITQMIGTTPKTNTRRQPNWLKSRNTPEARNTPTGQPPCTIEYSNPRRAEGTCSLTSVMEIASSELVKPEARRARLRAASDSIRNKSSR